MANGMALCNGHLRFASVDSISGGPFGTSYDSSRDFSALKEGTENCLKDDIIQEKKLIELMQEWMDSSHATSNVDETAENMDKLFQLWLGQYSEQKLPTTSLPFELAMRAWRNAGNGDRAFLVLDEWGHLLEGDMTLAPSLPAFHTVMDAYSRSLVSSQESLDSVENLLLHLERWHTLGIMWNRPRVETYAHVLRVMVRQEGQQEEMSRRALELLRKLQEVYPKDHTNVVPADVHFLVRSYSDVIGWMLNSCSKIDEALNLLQQMEASIENQDLSVVASYESSSWDENEEDEMFEAFLGRAYNAVIRQIAGSANEENIQNAEKIKSCLDRLERFADGGWSSLPWTQHYEASIEAWAKCVSPQIQADPDTEQLELYCEDLLHRMEARHLLLTSNHNGEIETARQNVSNRNLMSLKPYENVLMVMSRCGQGDKAEALLAHIRKLQNEGQIEKTHSFRWTRCWNFALLAHAHEGHFDRVFHLWNKIKEFSSVKPDSVTYATVLNSLSMITERHAARNAHSILVEMFDAYNKEGGNSSAVLPNAAHYGHVITAWSRSSERSAAHRAQEVFDQLQHEYQLHPSDELKPSVAHYSAVITAWGRSSDRDAIRKVEKLFRTMQELAETDKSLEPDRIVYGALIDALSRQKGREAAVEAERLLDHMETFSNQDASQGAMRPNSACYTSVITAWGRSGDKEAPARAENILRRLEHAYAETKEESLRPDSHAYAALLGAWANSGNANAGDRAEELLDQMKDGIPNKFVYSNVIRAHGRSGRRDSGERAEAILNLMEQRYAEGDLNAKPDAVAYTLVINAWARNASPEKAQRAWDLLRHMCKLYENGNLDVRPNVISFTAVLNACAHARGTKADREKAVRIALEAMTELLSKYGKPTHVTFRTMIEVFGRNVQDESQRSKLTSASFERCVQEGQVESSVIETLGKFVPKLHEKLPRDSQGIIELPSEWSRNVDKRRTR